MLIHALDLFPLSARDSALRMHTVMAGPLCIGSLSLLPRFWYILAWRQISTLIDKKKDSRYKNISLYSLLDLFLFSKLRGLLKMLAFLLFFFCRQTYRLETESSALQKHIQIQLLMLEIPCCRANRYIETVLLSQSDYVPSCSQSHSLHAWGHIDKHTKLLRPRNPSNEHGIMNVFTLGRCCCTLCVCTKTLKVLGGKAPIASMRASRSRLWLRG